MSETPVQATRPKTWEEWFRPAANHLPTVAELLPQEQKWAPGKTDHQAAWVLYTHLRTRISTAPLRYRDGVESAALKSLHELFVLARSLIEKHGRKAGHFATPTAIVFEVVVRPFTGHWHGQQESGALARQDNRRRFRCELRTLREQLNRFAEVLAVLAAGACDLESLAPDIDSGRPDTKRLWPDAFIGPAPEQGLRSAEIAAELNRIRERRAAAYVNDEARDFGGLGRADGNGSLGLVGLALSGGGIRSATFCLGVVQCLARHGIFTDVDYLSTVSGGGYLGAFLSSQLNPSNGWPTPGTIDELVLPSGRTGDSRGVRWLRNNSKYLRSKNWRENLAAGLQFLTGLLPCGPSWHKSYRERLAKAYLDIGGRPKMSELSRPGSAAPYHLINTAVNLPASKSIELRGRRSDFFVISREYVGSVTTGYCKTAELEARDKEFNLATAMAISAAAISPHSGMGTKRVWAPAMAAVNLRLGYWLPNPGKIASGQALKRFSALRSRWHEFWGNFSERDDQVHLSDGGHIENLGLYELLRRRCKLIIAVDGECDQGRTCGALIKASRLAAIDMNVKIDIDLSELAIDSEGLSQSHFAFGTINYGNRPGEDPEKGYLVYIKSSMTGNEPAYVQEYRTRNPSFPHETTADQLFDEDQFEAYRALGEHSASDLFGEDLVTGQDLKHVLFKARAWLEALCRELLPADRAARTKSAGGFSESDDQAPSAVATIRP